MNTTVTSREAILQICRQMVTEQGIAAVSMRSVAAACGIAVGSLYNYFPSKSDLIQAAVEDVWRDIFHMSQNVFCSDSFTGCLSWIFSRIRESSSSYPGFFSLHSMSFASGEKGRGRKVMEEYFQHIKTNMRLVLDRDPRVKPGAFDECFPKEEFIDMMFRSVTDLLLQNKKDCSFLLEMAARCIYENEVNRNEDQ